MAKKEKKSVQLSQAAEPTEVASAEIGPSQHEFSQEPTVTARTFDEKNPYYEILNQVLDPEIGIGIADMGLIYDVKEKKGLVTVVMTLTSMGCPAGPQLTTDVDGILRLQDHVKDVEIQVVWEPAWNPDMMKPELREMLFGGM